MVNIGDPISNPSGKITTVDETNKDIDLNTLMNNPSSTVLYFFPAVFTGVCTKSSCQIRDDIEEFRELGTNIYGVSCDMSFSQKVFIKQNEINYPLISDWNKEFIEAFDVVDNNFAGGLQKVPKRSLFAIRDGKVIYKWIGEHPGVYPPFEELKSALSKA